MAGKYRKDKAPQKSAEQQVVAPKMLQNNSYKGALAAYWNGQVNKAIELLSPELEGDSSIIDTAPLYRLWIEILADKGEIAALRHLADHFGFLLEAEEEPVIHTMNMALKGLIHFELDEVDAAKLMARSVADQKLNPYVLELEQLCRNRTNLDKVTNLLLPIKNHVFDYCQLATLAKTLYQAKDHNNLKWAVERIGQLYPEAPLAELFAMQDAVEKKQFEAAKSHARTLTKRFSDNVEFAFQYGYVAAKAGDHDNAITELTRASNMLHHEDPDVLSWLGFSLARKAAHGRNTVLKSEAENYLRKAITQLQSLGLPTTFASQELSTLQHAFNQVPQVQNNKLWMVKVSASEFHQLKTGALEQIETMTHALHPNAKAGDLCIIVGDDYASKALNERGVTWRLAALYSVTSNAYRHPLKGHVVNMTLINRQDKVSIPVNVTKLLASQNSDGKLDQSRIARANGVYELDADAQRVFADILEEFSDEAFHISDTLSYFRQSV